MLSLSSKFHQSASTNLFHRLAFVVLSFTSFARSLPTASSPSFTVDTGYAIFVGNNTLPNTVAYLGIPYAQSPPERFRASKALDITQLSKKKPTIDARSYPDFCVQGTTGNGDAGGAGSEDCLKVNIYTPKSATKKSKLPVLVYIHGGGYIFGNPANWPFDQWIEQSPNVVIVSVYYRLDSLGFLAHPAFLTDPSLGDLNAGFLDQLQALKWVNQHIASFGGDPTKVTINGQSAGGASVELHMVANEPQGLFKGVIAQSVYRTPVPTPEQQVELFETYAGLAGCGSKTGLSETMKCLRAADVGALARAQDAAKNIPYKLFHPVVDGKVITDFPTRLLAQGKFKNVAVIVGATSNETLAGGSDVTSALQGYFPSLTTQDIQGINGDYPASGFASDALRQLELTGDHSVRCGRELITAAVTKKGNKAFAYRYNALITGATSVFHSSENWMMFMGTSTGFNGTTTFQPQTPAQQAFARELIAYWLSFVRDGDPSTFKLATSPAWPSGTAQRIVLQDINGGSFVEAEPQDTVERCQRAGGLVAHEQA